MTLATLKGMNFNIGDVANAIKLRAAESVSSGVQRVTERATSTAQAISDVATGSSRPAAKSASKSASKGGKVASTIGGLVDPLQLWGSLTQQFQQIAAVAMKDATAKTAVDVTKNMATGMAKEALKSAKAVGKKATTAPRARTTAKKAGARSR